MASKSAHRPTQVWLNLKAQVARTPHRGRRHGGCLKMAGWWRNLAVGPFVANAEPYLSISVGIGSDGWRQAACPRCSEEQTEHRGHHGGVSQDSWARRQECRGEPSAEKQVAGDERLHGFGASSAEAAGACDSWISGGTGQSGQKGSWGPSSGGGPVARGVDSWIGGETGQSDQQGSWGPSSGGGPVVRRAESQAGRAATWANTRGAVQTPDAGRSAGRSAAGYGTCAGSSRSPGEGPVTCPGARRAAGEGPCQDPGRPTGEPLPPSLTNEVEEEEWWSGAQAENDEEEEENDKKQLSQQAQEAAEQKEAQGRVQQETAAARTDAPPQHVAELLTSMGRRLGF